jgi:Zn-dependent protease with chaperone function
MIIHQILIVGFLSGLHRLLKSAAVFRDFGFVGEQPFVIGVALLLTLSGRIQTILMLPINLLHRWFEYQADVFAATSHLDVSGALLRLSSIIRLS